MLAGVADCGRGLKWYGRGRLALGFKPMHGSHAWLGPRSLGREELGSFWDHVAWAEKNHVTSISFSKIQYPRLDRGGRKDCVFVGILKDFGISLKTLSHYS